MKSFLIGGVGFTSSSSAAVPWSAVPQISDTPRFSLP